MKANISETVSVRALLSTQHLPISRSPRSSRCCPSCYPISPRINSNPFGYLPLPGLRGVSKRMPEVVIHDDESFERALKRFKKKCEKAGILSDLRKHRHFEKPSEKRKRKMNAAVRKNRRGPRVPRG